VGSIGIILFGEGKWWACHCREWGLWGKKLERRL